MPQPTAYTRQADFSSFEASNPTDPKSGISLDAEFDALKVTTDGLRANLGLLQRDDGALANLIVTPDSLSASTRSLLSAQAGTIRGTWVTATAYALKDVVLQSDTSYICAVAHTSGTFATDLAAGRWLAMGATTAAAVNFTPSGSGATTRTVQAVLRDHVSVRDFGATGDGTTNDTAAIQAAIDAIAAAGGGNLYFPSGTYLVSGSITSGATVHWIMVGGIVNVTGSVTINGGVQVIPFHTQAFTVASAVAASSKLKIRNVDAAGGITAGNSCSPYVDRISPMWFDGASMSVKIQKAFQVGSSKTRCSIPPGHHTVTTTISLNETDYGSHLILEGESYISTTLEAAGNAALCIIDAAGNGGSDEAEIRHLRVIEGSGGRTCICIALGGTSLKVNDCWTGNAKYGLYQNRGAGTRITNHFSENCDYEYFCAPNHSETANISGAPAASGGISDILIQGGKLHSSVITNVRVLRAGTNVVRGLEMNGVTLNDGGTYCLEVSDTNTSLGVKGFRMIGGSIQGANDGGASPGCGARINNCDAAFIGTVFEDNYNTGLKAAGSVEVEMIGCFFGNYSGNVQTTNTATESGSPTITETASVAI
jgi:hypothetical protein